MMLQFIRDRAQGWIAWVLVSLIILVFALFGIQDYAGHDPNVAVAEVNGAELGLQRYHQAYQRQRAQLQVATDDPALEQRLKLDTVERLIQDEIIVQTALQNGLRISDAQLTAALQAQQAFQVNGEFSRDQYSHFVRNQGFSEAGFEFNYRRTLLADQIFSALSDTAFATQSEIDGAAGLQTQRRSYATLRLPASKYTPESVDDDALNAYYEANKAVFRSVEQVKVAYVVLSRSSLEAAVKLDDDELKSVYESRKASFRTPEERRARHILVTVGIDADDAAVQKAEDEINAIRKRIEDGEDFEKVAGEASQDPGSAQKGGDLGFFATGWMAPEFERAAYAQEIGALGQPVRTQFGFHLIRVEEVRGGEQAPFEDVREQLATEYRMEQVEGPFYAQVDDLTNLAYEQPDNLDIAAEELALEIQTSDWVTRSGIADDPVLSNPNVLRAIFSETVLQARNNSEAITVDEGNAVTVVRVVEYAPSAEQPLADVRTAVLAAVQRTEASKAAETAGTALLAKLRAGDDPASVANGASLEWQDHAGATRYGNQAVVGGEGRELAFQMPKPDTDKSVFDGRATAGGDYIIVRLTGVGAAEEGAEDVEQARTVQRALLARNMGSRAFQSLLDSLRDTAEVEIFEDRF
ncbi:MAG: SurA N-terminal domain-containing protein [Pseudomonadota bacterium]